MDEQTDIESLGAWAEAQGAQTQRWLLTRCALRDLPGVGLQDRHPEFGKILLASWRGVLIATAGVVRQPNQMLQDAAKKSARDLHYVQNDTIRLDPDLTAHMSAHGYMSNTCSVLTNLDPSAAKGLNKNRFSYRAFSSAYNAELYRLGFSHNDWPVYERDARFDKATIPVAMNSAIEARAVVISAANADTQTPNGWSKLWPDSEMPVGLNDAWNKIRAFSERDPKTWGFWLEWYEAILKGAPLPWELSFRIATELTEEDWDAGPEHVAGRINEIRADFLATALPLAETLEINEDTGLFRTVPIEVQNPDLIVATLDRVGDALDDALANPSNGLTERSRETRVIRRTVERYGNNPQRIEMDLTDIHGRLTHQIATEDLPPSEENLALVAACEQGAQSIRATHPDVAENRETLRTQAMRELPDTARAQLEAAQPVLEAISEEPLAEEWREDIGVLIEEGGEPPRLYTGTRNPVLASYAEKQRVFSRVAKMAIVLRAPVAAVDRIAEATGLTRGSVLSILLGLIGIAVSLL